MDTMKNEVKVSLILPSLNVGKYIAECIESAINQTLQEIEIICVDAGSTDGTLEIIEEYAERDDRIQVIKSDRKSYGHQMNLGIEAATGDYIGILETDDIAPPEMYEELYEKAFFNRADLVKADFYRFTGSGEEMEKDLIRVVGKKSWAYNKVIDVSQHKECFNFVMNTWSGIYRREFLLENNIWHHETPGASFQDNGFWFQTFMNAKRALFVNKAYYMNRRDREDSSVFDIKNVYTICEEYDWIEEKLKSIPGCYEEYGPLHAYFAFRNYKWTLDRIKFADKPEFYLRMKGKFEGYKKTGVIDYNLFRDFNENLGLSLWAMLERPEEFYDEFYRGKQRIIEEIPQNRPVIIYGAGKVGMDCLEDFLKMERNGQVIYFAVTKKNGSEKPYLDVPVYGIDELTAWAEEATIILAVKPAFREEMMMNLLYLGFCDIKHWPDSEYVLRDEYAPKLQSWQNKLETGYVFPYEDVEKGSNIVLYGDNEVAESYYKQMEKTGYANIVQWLVPEDSAYQGVFPVESLESIGNVQYDYVLISYGAAEPARRAGWELLNKGISPETMIWAAGNMCVVKKQRKKNEELIRFEMEDYLGMMRDKIRREKESLHALLQEENRVLSKVVLLPDAGIAKSMLDFASLMEKVDVCISLRIYMGAVVTKENIMSIVSSIPKNKTILSTKIVLVNPHSLDDDSCKLMADSDIGITIIYTNYSLLQAREEILEKLNRVHVQADCLFECEDKKIAKDTTDVVLLDNGKIYKCFEGCIYKDDFNIESAEYKSSVAEFSFGKLFD